MLPPAADRPKLKAVLDPLAAAVEELLLGGLTTASDATRQTVSVAMQEAGRLRLLRLGVALRTVNEDLGRYRALSAQDVRAAAASWLPVDRRVELIVEPQKAAQLP